MNWTNAIPWTIAGIGIVVAILTLYFSKREKRLDTIAKQQGKISALQKKVDAYENISEKRERLRLQDQVYYLKGLDGKSETGPFCSVCFENKHNLYPIQVNDNGYGYCNNCKETYVYNKKILDRINAQIERGNQERDSYLNDN